MQQLLCQTMVELLQVHVTTFSCSVSVMIQLKVMRENRVAIVHSRHQEDVDEGLGLFVESKLASPGYMFVKT